jgi:hypothetical protein
VDQYVPAPEPGNTSQAPPSAGDPGVSGVVAESPGDGKAKKDEVVVESTSDGSSGGVELPVSDGYPVTPFVILVAILLAGGVAARLITRGMRRKEGSA